MSVYVAAYSPETDISMQQFHFAYNLLLLSQCHLQIPLLVLAVVGIAAV